MKFYIIFSIILLSKSIYSSTINSTELNVTRRIINGFIIGIEDAPYQAAVLSHGNQFCGGSLISRNFVLTAAHCKDAPKNLSVIIGTNNWSKNIDKKINVVKFHSHPKFMKYRSFDYDFGLIELYPIYELPEVVKFAVLPEPYEEIEDDERLLVSGWGRTETNRSSSLLRAVVVPKYNSEKCKKAYTYLTTRMFCAGYEEGGKDSCQGDSGGPIVRMSDKKLFGLVSFGEDCAERGYPGVYAKITSVLDWIYEVTNLQHSEHFEQDDIKQRPPETII